MSGPRLFSPPPGGFAVEAEEGAVAEPFGMAPTPDVFSFGDDSAVRVPFLAGFAFDGGPESMSIASTSPLTGSSTKAWCLDLDASVDSCAFEAPFCCTDAFRAAFGLFVASDGRRGEVSFASVYTQFGSLNVSCQS